MRDSWWGGASCQAPQAGAFATAPQLLSHSQASPTPAPVLPCALSSPQHVPAAPGLLTRPPASLQEVVLLPSNSCSDLEVAALASRSGKTEYMHIHTHTCLCTHNSLPTCSHPPMRVHTRSPRGVGGVWGELLWLRGQRLPGFSPSARRAGGAGGGGVGVSSYLVGLGDGSHAPWLSGFCFPHL